MAVRKKLDSKTIAQKELAWKRFSAKSKKAPVLSPAALAKRNERMAWWRQARFGMFIHLGLYSVLGRHEWAMNLERWDKNEYAGLTEGFLPAKGSPRKWARLARLSGMKYLVLTTKHHEGFCLWDTKQTPFNSVNFGPKRDIVAEYVQACRDEGLKVGFYYSLMDWKHSDGDRCAYDEKARLRFVDYTEGCVRELMSNYGHIDILWYDVPWPLTGAKQWNTIKINRMARRLQPHIIINDRSWLCEDYTTPEEHITPPAPGRDWEACMTMNGSWGYMPAASDYCGVRDVIGRISAVTRGSGNLLLNIGPRPDGSVSAESAGILRKVGKWLADNGEAVYGDIDRVEDMEWLATGTWSARGNTYYFWCNRWAGDTIILGGLVTKLRNVTMLATGKKVKFSQDSRRTVLHGLPEKCPDPHGTGWVIFKMEFASRPRLFHGPGCVEL